MQMIKGKDNIFGIFKIKPNLSRGGDGKPRVLKKTAGLPEELGLAELPWG